MMDEQQQYQNPFALLTVEDLAKILRRAIATIRTDAVRRPGSLPPRCRIPGRRLLWRREDVLAWAESFVDKEASQEDGGIPQPLAPPERLKKKRGRPTKLESHRRAAEKYRG